MTPEQRASFTSHAEDVGEFGWLELGYRDLAPLRAKVEPPCGDPRGCVFEATRTSAADAQRDRFFSSR